MKASTQQIAQVIVQTSEEIKESTQRIGKSAQEIDKVLENKVKQLSHIPLTVDATQAEKVIDRLDQLVEKRMKDLEKERKQSPYLLYSLGILVVSVVLLVLAFKYGYQTKQELRLELEKESVIVPKEDYTKLKGFADNYAKDFKKYSEWVDKNK